MCVKLYFRLLFFAMQEIGVKCKSYVKVPAAWLGGVFYPPYSMFLRPGCLEYRIGTYI